MFRKENNVSIVLWRGKDQTLLSFQNSIDMFLETKFRDVSNAQRDKRHASYSVASTNDMSM